jgi:hypothetical protein
MKRIVPAAAAGLLALALATPALACAGHPEGHTADASKPVTTAEKPAASDKTVNEG